MPRKGQRHTPEALAKMSASHRGYKPTPETLAKLSAARMGNRNAAGHRQPQGELNRAVNRARMNAIWSDPERRAAMRAAMAVPKRPIVGQCSYCGGPATEYDHILPMARGGTDIAENRVPCCRSCNASKGNRTPEEWLAAGLRSR